MAHVNQMNFVKKVKYRFSDSFYDKRVLEIGSLNINGTVRDFFTKCEYIGCDLGAGRDVDVICAGKDLAFPDRHFDTSISCECFEHDKDWKETFANMVRMTDRLVIFSCATTGRAEHGTTATTPQDAPFTNDYYKNLTEQDFREAFNLDELFDEWFFAVNDESHDLYFYGVRK